MRTSLNTVINLKMFFHLQALAPFWVAAFDTRQTITLFPYAIFLSSCFQMFPTDSLLIPECTVSPCFMHMKTKLTALCKPLCLTESRRISVAISTAPSITQDILSALQSTSTV